MSKDGPIHIRQPDTVMVQRFKCSDWKPYATVTREHFVNLPSREIPLSIHGGRGDRQEHATGFFHAKQIDGTWTLVDPGGAPFLSIGVNFVRPEHDQPDSRYAFAATMRTCAEWAAQTHGLLRDELGFNTLSWSSAEAFHKIDRPMPYTLHLNIMGDFARSRGLYEKSYGSTDMKNQVLPVFHQDFPAHVDRCFQTIAPYRSDRWVLGVFSDNEIPLYERKIIARYLAMGADDPGALRAKAWLSECGHSEDKISAEHDREFCKYVLSTYFALVKKAMDKHLPNHMYLGTRFHKAVTSQLSAYEVLGRYADVVSVNLYHRWTPDQHALTQWSRAAGRPLLITEWYAKGDDSGLRNQAGAGMTVRTQAERAKFYENFTLHLLRNPNVVGWHWFRYMDEPPLRHGRASTNKGLVNHHYTPYAELAGAMKRINREAYSLRDELLALDCTDLPDTAAVVEDPEFDEIETERV